MVRRIFSQSWIGDSMNLSWWLERSYWERPTKTVVVDADATSVTYEALRVLVNQVATVLRDDAGIGQDDMVMSIMPDSHRHVAVFYAALRLGGVFSGLNPTALPEKHRRDIERTQARVLVVSPDNVELAGELQECESVETVYVLGGAAPAGMREMSKLFRDDVADVRIAPRSHDDLAAVNFTSGTSGSSKGVMFTHGTLQTSAWGSIFLGGITSDVRNVSLIGMYHSGGIHDSVRLVMAGGTILWSQGWDVDRVVRIIKEHRPNWMYYIIPTMVRDLMRHPEWAELDLKGLRTYVAGEPVPKDVEDALTGRGAEIANMYGLTEAMPVCVLGPSFHYGDQHDIPRGSSGKPNREFCDVKLADPFTGEELQGGDVEGEVCIRGDVVTPGYVNDPERTAEAFDEDGFLHTRDRAYRDSDGWYFIRGRTDDIINTGGEKLSLIEVDETLRMHPAVRDAACVGVAHQRFGQVPAGIVALEGDVDIDDDELCRILDEHCLAHLERWKRPRLYIPVEEVPRTTAKRSKQHGQLRTLVEGIVLRESDGITTPRLLSRRSDDSTVPPHG